MSNNMRTIILLSLFFSGSYLLQAQESLLDDLNQLEEMEKPKEDLSPKKERVLGVFFGNRVINGQSTETLPKNTMEFIIGHRFGRINGGFYEFWGLDAASIRIGLEYSATDWLAVSVGRSSFLKTWDGYVKARFLSQKENGMPISAAVFLAAAMDGRKNLYPDDRPTFLSQRMSYTSQLLISSKVTKWLSLQLMPTITHYNLVETRADDNTVFLLGAAARVKIKHNFGLTAEYYPMINKNDDNGYRNAVAVGFDFSTGGHVFQIQLTNAQAMFDSGFMRQTTGNFWDGDIHLGFNITRNFALGHNKGSKKSKSKDNESW
jgi:hypothetical protein